MEAAPATASRKKGQPSSPSASVSSALAATGGDGWSDLPEGLLLSVVDRLPSVVDLLAVAAVCRFWRAVAGPATSASAGGGRPPLLLRPVFVPLGPRYICRRWLYSRSCRLLSPADPAASHRCLIPPSILASPFLGYSHGHLIFCLRRRRPLLADAATGDVLRTPELPRDREIDHGVLTAPLSAPGCSLLLYSVGSVLLRWRVGEREWSEHPLPGADAVCMTRITVFRGRVLTLDPQCRLFTVEFSPSFRVRQLAVRPPESSDVSVRYSLRGQLVESGGELLLVCFVSAQTAKVENVVVFRLDVAGPPAWVRVESLGERALFIDREHGSSVSCSNPRRWGGRSNCIYLVRRGSLAWTPVPLDGRAINVCDGRRISLEKWPSPIWVYPSWFY